MIQGILFSWITSKRTYHNALRPLLLKVEKDGEAAYDMFQYVDNACTLDLSEEQLWLVQRKMIKTLSFLGLQDAVRKRRMGNQYPGAWAGSVVSTNKEVVMKSVTQEQWKNMRTKI